MATNRFYQRYGFIKGKSFTKMNHFSDKGNGLDPVSVDLQKSIWWNVPLKILSRRAADSGEDGKNTEREAGRLPHRAALSSLSLSSRLEGRPSAQRGRVGGNQVTMTELRQHTSLTASMIQEQKGLTDKNKDSFLQSSLPGNVEKAKTGSCMDPERKPPFLLLTGWF